MEIVELVQNNMLDYSAAVNQDRAIPDARTGLKPIHRKILYEMYADEIKSTGKYKKCAYMVGQIIARFSEHGDAATYDALVRLAQPWIQRYPLLDFHGNYGSQFGDSAAAMRYTESKLSKLSESGFLYGLDKNNVDWKPNFTNEEDEPITLPAVFPGLFCLPNQGIGYAVACNFLTYNLKEIADVINAYITRNEIKEICFDLASGGTIVNPQIMSQIYNTGKGTVVVESKYTIKNNKIIITELPFNVMLEDVLDEIISFGESEDNEYIIDAANNSGNGKLELTITCTSSSDAEKALDILFEKTKLRNSYGVNQIALVDNKPKLLTFKDMLDVYVFHNIECIKREFNFEYEKTLKRIHIIEGILKALNDIDNVIYIIKNSSKPREELKEVYVIDDEQVKAIMEMRLSKLAKLEVDKLMQEYNDKKEFAAYCKQIFESEDKQKDILLDRLNKLVNKYGDERRTKIEQKSIKKAGNIKTSKAEFVPENVVVEVTNNGYLKVIPVKMYKANKKVALVYKEKTLNNDYLQVFTNLGKMYRIPLKNIKTCGSNDKGIVISTLINMLPKEKILFTNVDNGSTLSDYIIFVTENGLVKKTNITQFSGTTGNLKGLKAMNLKNDDSIVFISSGLEEDNITITTETNSIYFSTADVSYQGKTAGGVKGINTNNRVISVTLGENKNMTLQKRGGIGRKI